ncbi:hypothetical protein [Paenibacillus sp. sgz302251]|uniref:hypothetical protein n=1 Tax=Paenibacillus sp. sgz302251 TaxID=3414493 RepID=UPI003C7B1D2B
MWPVIGVSLFTLIVFMLELPKLSKAKQFKEIVFFSLLAVGALLIYVLQTLHVNLPNPLLLIEWFYMWLGLVIR